VIELSLVAGTVGSTDGRYSHTVSLARAM